MAVQNLKKRINGRYNPARTSILLTVSCIAGMLGFFIYLNGNLRERHPYKLYAFQLIGVSGHYIATQSLIFFDLYKFYQVFNVMLGQGGSLNRRTEFGFYTNLLIIDGCFDQIFLVIYEIITLLIFLDIYLITRCPWKNHQTRNVPYKYVTTAVCSAWSVLIILNFYADFYKYI